MDQDEQHWPERRKFSRIEMYAGIFVVQGERAYLTEMQDVSAGGLSISRPGNWRDDPGGDYQLYCILEQERILCVGGRVAHEAEDTVGMLFQPGYAVQAEQLLAESRNWR